MNRRLTEFQIRSTCRELITRHPKCSGRQLRQELKSRFGAVGKTERVFEVWREETEELERAKLQAALPTEVAELQRQLKVAEGSAAENLKRAELAEYRECAHQDHWAMELDRLRQEIETLRQGQAGQRASIPFRV
jgi:Plasmid replication region DNA-binding N-term